MTASSIDNKITSGIMKISTGQPLFDGYYGMQNIGDDVFCVISAWGAKHYWQAQCLRFAATTLPVMPGSIGPLSPQAIFNGKPLLGGYLRSLLTLLYRSVYAARSSVIVYAGGSTLLDMPMAKRLLQGVANFLAKPLVGIGLSIGPFKTEQARQDIINFLQQFSFLTLRDRASLAEAQKMSLPYTPIRTFDLAGLLPSVYGSFQRGSVDSERLMLGVGLGYNSRRLRTPETVLKEQRLTETLIRLAKKTRIQLRFCVFNGHPVYGDLDLAQQMTAALKPFCPVEIVPYTNDPGQMWRKVAECRAFLAERLHSAIFAYMAQTPLAIIEYHRKCTDFAQDIALPELYRFPGGGPEPESAAEILANLLLTPQLAQMPVEEAQQQAKLNFVTVPR